MTHRRRCRCCGGCEYFSDDFTRAPSDVGDTGAALSAWSLDLAGYPNDTDTLYWTYTAPVSFPGTGTVSVYSDAAHTAKVAEGTGTVPADSGSVAIALAAQGGSSITGSVTVQHDAVTDDDAANELDWEIGSDWTVTAGTWEIEWDGAAQNWRLATASSNAVVKCLVEKPGDPYPVVIQVEFSGLAAMDAITLTYDADGASPKRVVLTDLGSSTRIQIYDGATLKKTSTFGWSPAAGMLKVCLREQQISAQVGQFSLSTAYYYFSTGAVAIANPTGKTLTLGTGTITASAVRFDRFSISYHGEERAGCPYCQCMICESVVNHWRLGVTGSGPPSCVYQGTFDLATYDNQCAWWKVIRSWPTSPCSLFASDAWSVEFSLNPALTEVTVVVLLTVQCDLNQGYWYWRKTWPIADFLCNEISEVEIPFWFNTGNPPFVCTDPPWLWTVKLSYLD